MNHTLEHTHATTGPASRQEDTNAHVETHKNSRLALAIAFLALFFTVLGITVGYKHWLRIHDKAKLALQQITLLQQQLENTASKDSVASLQSRFEENANAAERRLADSLQALDQIRAKTAYSAQSVTRQIAELTLQQQQAAQPGNQQAQLTEIRFLLESANRRLALNYDKAGALALLQEADRLLIQLNAPRWLPVREKLAQDIATLQQFHLPDIEQLTTQIDDLENSIPPLANMEKNLTGSQQVALFKDADTSTLPGKLKQYINDAITIHKQTDPPRYALDKSNKERVDLLLKLRLEALRLMLIQRHNAAYHQQIKRLRNMLENYYPPTVARPWLDILDKLDQERLTPPLPDISSARNQFVTLLTTDTETD